MVERILESLGRMLQKRLADTGYCSEVNLERARRLDAEHGTEYFISTGRMKHSAPTRRRRGAGSRPMRPWVRGWRGK